ncbi:MAG: hypothetical protein JWR63_2957 [Conexibacter sp.]|nr:hypothetical protein [Conexibacter sp.]
MSMARRASRRTDRDPMRRVLGRALAVTAVLGTLGWLAVSVISGVPGRDYQDFDAIVSDPGSLIKFDPVRIGGVRVGQLQSITSTRGGDARLRLQLDPGTTLTADTSLRVRANGLLGSRFVELVPGRSTARLPEGSTIRGDESSLTFGVPESLDVFDERTRKQFRPLVGELGRALLGRGDDVNDLLRAGAETVPPSSDLFEGLNRQSDANAMLLPGLASMMRPLDANRRPLFAMSQATGDALQPFVDRREPTREILARAPAALGAADSGLAAGSRLLDAARALGTETTRTLRPAPEALGETEQFLQEARRPLERAEPALRTLRSTISPTLRLTSALRPVLPRMTGLFQRLLPIVTTLGPYGCDLKNFGVVVRSMTSVGTRQPGGPAGPAKQFRLQVPAPDPASSLSLDTDAVKTIDRVAYPEPCQFLSKPYPVVDPGAALPGGRR